MKVIPVIDLLGKMVVHAVRGRRQEYQPLKSVLCSCAEPVKVAQALRARGFRELYVADLDAIMGKGSNTSAIRQISKEPGLEVMLDAGVADVERAEEAFLSGASKIIVGTETLKDLAFVKVATEMFGADRVIVSLDLMNGKVLSQADSLRLLTTLEAAQVLQRMGAHEIIVLDLARVGSGEGADFVLLQKLRKEVAVNLLVGGGMRDIQDLKTLAEMGVFGVLVATALHSGKISVKQMAQAGFMP